MTKIVAGRTGETQGKERKGWEEGKREKWGKRERDSNGGAQPSRTHVVCNADVVVNAPFIPTKGEI